MHSIRAAIVTRGTVALTPWAPSEMNSDTHESQGLDTQTGLIPETSIWVPHFLTTLPTAASSQPQAWVLCAHNTSFPSESWIPLVRNTSWHRNCFSEPHLDPCHQSSGRCKGGFLSNARLLPGTVSHSPPMPPALLRHTSKLGLEGPNKHQRVTSLQLRSDYKTAVWLSFYKAGLMRTHQGY